MKETAHVAYDAYGDSVRWLNFAGNPMPGWADLPEKIQRAWRDAVEAVARSQGAMLLAIVKATTGDVDVTAWGWSPSYVEVLKLRRAFELVSGGRSVDEILNGSAFGS